MKTLLGIPKNKIDVLKYIMQLRCVVTWVKSGAKGTIEAATGFGKSIIACIALKKIVLANPERHAMVVVPTRQLKEQWEEVLKAFGLEKNATVFVINSIALKEVTYNVDFLIIDEIHMMAADKFSRIFKLVNYKWIMGLTATIDRLDGKEHLLKQYAPVVKTIPQKMAIERGWINNFVEMNVPVFLTRDEKAGLHNLSKQIRYYAAKFGDFDEMRKCMNFGNATAYAQLYFPQDNPKEKAAELVKDAVQGQRCVQKRQEFLYKTQHKVEATVDLINEFGLKTITFSQSTAFADEVRKAVGARAVAYHSNLETIVRNETKTKDYKQMQAALLFADKIGGTFIKKGGRNPEKPYRVKWKELRKVGAMTRKKEAIEQFSKQAGKIDVICTAKALDQGFDVPDVQLGVDASRTSNPTQHTQRTGRIARKFMYKDGTEKQGLYVNFYVPDSRDEQWLRKCQKNSTNVLWLQDVDECKQLIKTVLDL